MEDRSLDDFFESGEESSEQSDPATAADSNAEGRQVEPTTITARWDSDGLPCDRCEEPVSRLWQEGEASVCPACKEW